MTSSQKQLDKIQLHKKVDNLMCEEKYDLAMSLLDDWNKKYPNDYQYHLFIADCYHLAKNKLQNFVAAEKHYLEAIKLSQEKKARPIANYLSLLVHETFEMHKGSKYKIEYLL